MVIIGIVGAPCSGKRTIAELLADSGFLLRDLRTSHLAPVLAEVQDSPAANWVIFPIHSLAHSAFSGFTFYKLLWVDAPVGVRYVRYTASKANITLEEFVAIDDKCVFTIDFPLRSTAIRVINSGSKEELSERLKRLPQTCKDMRKAWDSFYMGFARQAARRSNCMKSPVGAVVVKDNHIISCGYNGTPVGLRNCIEGGCGRCNENSSQGKHLDKCYCVHAEVNSILYAGRKQCQGGTLYATMKPCLNCAKTLVQVGISRIVYLEDYSDLDSTALLTAVGVELAMLEPDNNPYLV